MRKHQPVGRAREVGDPGKEIRGTRVPLVLMILGLSMNTMVVKSAQPAKSPWEQMGTNSATRKVSPSCPAARLNTPNSVISEGTDESRVDRSQIFTLSGTEFTRAGRVCSIAFSSNSRLLAFANLDGGINLWDLRRRRQVWKIAMPPQGAVSEEYMTLAFASDGKRLILASDIRDPVVLDTQTGRTLRTLVDGSDWLVSAVSICRIGMEETALTASAGNVHFWNLATGAHKQLKGAGGEIVALDVVRDGSRVALGQRSGHVIVQEIQSGRVLFRERQSEFPIRHVAIMLDGKVLISGSDDGLVAWNIDRKTRLWTIREKVLCLAIHPRAETFACGSDDARLLLRSVRTGKIVAQTPYGSKSTGAVAVAFNPDGSAIAAGTNDGRVAVWRLEYASRD